MGEGFQFFDIILFAMIAAFLVLRLRSVLGRRDGHDGSGHRDQLSRRQSTDQTTDQKTDQTDDNVIALPDKAGIDIKPAANSDTTNTSDSTMDANDPLAQGLRAVQEADPQFNTAEFLPGSKAAFEMILGSFAEGDKDTLKSLLNADVYANFEKAIRNREDSGEQLEFTLIGIKKADVVEAYLENSYAHVTVKFISEQVNVLHDKDDNVIDGDPERIVEVTDFWTFARDTNSRNPNWSLVATRSLD